MTAPEATGPRLLLGTREGLLALHLTEDGAGWAAAEVLWRGGNVRALAVDPDEPARVHLTAAGDGLYRSEDGGRTWERYLAVEATTLVVRPDRPELLYLGASPAEVFRSTDFGDHWTALGIVRAIGEPLRPATEWRHVRDLVFDPADGAKILAVVAGGGLLATFDGGRTWVELSTHGLPAIPCCLRHQSTPRMSWIAGSPRGLHRSFDHGFHWQRDDAGIAEPVVTHLASQGAHALAAAREASAISAPVRAQIYRRPPGAARWWPAGEPLSAEVTAMQSSTATEIAAWRDAAFAALADGSVWCSRGVGAPWSRLARGLPSAHALAWQPAVRGLA